MDKGGRSGWLIVGPYGTTRPDGPPPAGRRSSGKIPVLVQGYVLGRSAIWTVVGSGSAPNRDIGAKEQREEAAEAGF
jgi:hypothetical protein